jgi:hypothetical protein
MKSEYLIEQGEQGAHGVMALAFMPNLNFKQKKLPLLDLEQLMSNACTFMEQAHPSYPDLLVKFIKN